MPASPEQVLRELAELWTTLAKPADIAAGGVLRACALTLMVAFDEGDDATAIGETVAALMPEHPSRAVLLELLAAAGPTLEARVTAHCWLPFGEQRQICCEQIGITVGRGALGALPPFLLPLAAPDLPVFLWCRSPGLFTGPAWPALAAFATKAMVDTAALGEPASALELFSSRARSAPRLADLAWTRLTRWRSLISRFFENRDYLPHLSRIRAVRLTDAGIASRYLAAWLLHGLRQAGASPALHLEEKAAQLRHVALLTEDAEFSITRDDSGCATIVTPGATERASLPVAGDYMLLREELSITGRDPVFEKVLAETNLVMYLDSE